MPASHEGNLEPSLIPIRATDINIEQGCFLDDTRIVPFVTFPARDSASVVSFKKKFFNYTCVSVLLDCVPVFMKLTENVQTMGVLEGAFGTYAPGVGLRMVSN